MGQRDIVLRDIGSVGAISVTGFLPPSLPLTYKALVVIHGPKGCGETCATLGPGLLRTTEYLTQQSLNLDVGKMAWDTPNQFSVWVGYRWWGRTRPEPTGEQGVPIHA